MKALRWVCVCMAVLWGAPAAADDTEKAIAFADSLAQQALEIVKNDNLNAKAKQLQLETLFEKRVDIDWVSRFALGRHWHSASEAQRTAYQKNYRDFILKYYTSRLTDYTGQEYKILNARPSGDEGEYLVRMELVNTNEPNVLVDYRLRRTDGEFQIFDIIIEGVSMITTQRSEFASVIGNKGLDYLITALEKKAAAAKG